MALGMAQEAVVNIPRGSAPYPDAGVETSGGNADTVKGDGVDLAVVALQGVQASALGYAPHLGHGIVAARDDNIGHDLQTPHTSLVTDEHVSTQARPNVPHAERRIPGTRDGRISVRHLKAAHRRRVAP